MCYQKSKTYYMIQSTEQQYGIAGLKAPKLKVKRWINGKGISTEPITLSSLKGKFKVIYCFQAWCPGCHSVGLPSLQKMVTALKDNEKVAFLAIQTVFEGAHANTFKRLIEIQKEYELSIPFGQDEGAPGIHNVSYTMQDYKTGGTPWFILIDEEDKVLFNDFHLDTEKAIEYLKSL